MPRVLESWTYVRGGTMLYTGVSLQAAGEGAAAERLLTDSFEHYANKADPFGLRLLMPLCFNYFAQGKLEQMRQTAFEMLRLCASQPLATMQSWAEYFLGLAYYEWNQLAAAESHFAAVAERRHLAIMVVVRDAMQQLALLQQLRGSDDEAQRTLEQLSELELEQNGREDEGTRGLRARLLLTAADSRAPPLGRCLGEAGAGHSPGMAGQPDLAKVRILLARQHATDLPAAQHLLEALDVLAEQSHNTRFRIEILALLAVAHASKAARRRHSRHWRVRLNWPGQVGSCGCSSNWDRP